MSNEIVTINNSIKILSRFYKLWQFLRAEGTSVAEVLLGNFLKVIMVRQVFKVSLYFQPLC